MLPSPSARRYPGLDATLALVLATHPVPAASVTALAAFVGLALGAERPEVLWIVASTAFGQASVGWSNDYLDRFRDAAAGRSNKPLMAGRISPSVVASAAVFAAILSPLLALPLGLHEAAVMAVALASAWAYNFGLKASVLSWLPYSVSFSLFPVFAWLAARDSLPPAWIPVVAALLAVAAHVANVAPDLAGDRSSGMQGLPHRLGVHRGLLLACTLLTAVLALVVARGSSLPHPLAILLALTAIGAVAWTALAGRLKAAFYLTIAAVAAIVLVMFSSRPPL